MTRRSIPAPKPALRRAPDGTVHPASPSHSSLAVNLRPVLDTKSRKGKEGKEARREDRRLATEEQVLVTVSLPRSVRKKLRRRAEEYGWNVEEASANVLRVWADS